MEINDQREQATEYIYKEYVRLSEICTSFVNGSFQDIRLYGAIGSVLAWGPIAGSSLFKDGNTIQIAFLGFFAILVISIILFYVNSMKQSLVEFYLLELHTYEDALRSNMDLDAKLFQWSVHYPQWRSTEIRKIGIRLASLSVFILIAFPTVILYSIDNTSFYPWLYAGISILFIVIYIQVVPTPLKKKQ